LESFAIPAIAGNLSVVKLSRRQVHASITRSQTLPCLDSAPWFHICQIMLEGVAEEEPTLIVVVKSNKSTVVFVFALAAPINPTGPCDLFRGKAYEAPR
jgi:hypothetical protein